VLTIRHLLAAALLLLAAPAFAAPPKVTVTFDNNGLATLQGGDTPLLKSGALVIDNVFFADDQDKHVAADRSNPTISFERTAQRVSHSWPWGAIRCRYTLAGTRLNLDLTIENDTAGPMSGVELSLLELQFPRRPAGTMWERRLPMMADSEDDITALVADYGSGMLTFCNDDPGTVVRAGFSPGSRPPQETWNLKVTSINTSGGRKVFVQPRSHRTFRFSLRFSEAGVALKTVAGDLMEKFAAAHPFQLKWPDRRPIGVLTLASSEHRSATNPRGWLSDPKLNFVGPGGAKRFREKILAAADRSIALLREMGAQGMIFWDMEGEEFPDISYVGDPRMTKQLAPEMDPVAPEFFARFHKAGFRTGVCLRPSRIIPGKDGKSKWQHDLMGFDVVEELSQKIAYARKRLGCRLFAVDANVRWFLKPDGTPEPRLLETAAFKRLADAHPEALLIPEIPLAGYWSCTAPYQELRPGLYGGRAATDARIRDIYPRAFSVISPIDGPAPERRAEIVAGQRLGDLLLFRCWFPDEQNKLFKEILKEAAETK